MTDVTLVKFQNFQILNFKNSILKLAVSLHEFKFKCLISFTSVDPRVKQ